MVLSLDPVVKIFELHAAAPTLFECPYMILILFILFTSQICTSPLLVPIDKWGLVGAQETEVTVSDMPRSHNLLTLELLAFHK